MEYISLNSLRNNYPSIQNYKKKDVNVVQLAGNFEPNFIDFNLPDLGVVTKVDGTSFKFIIELRADVDADSYIGLYTSPIFYNELLTSTTENNPYPLRSAFFTDNIVTYYINELTTKYNELIDLETELDVKMDRNILYRFDGDIQYDELIKYIDWNVSSPTLNEIGSQNVLPISQLSEYTYAQYNVDSASFEYVDNTLNDIRLSKLENELSNINSTIIEIEDYLVNPDAAKLKIPGGAVAKLAGPVGVKVLSTVGGTAVKAIIAKIIPSALLGPVGIIGGAVLAAASIVLKLIGAKKKKKQQEEQIEQHLNKLKSELVKLKERRIIITDEIQQLKGQAVTT
jgi:hypothetical protein